MTEPSTRSEGVNVMTIPARGLRAWAQGHYPTEAAVELLIRAKGGRFARETQPWIEPLEQSALYGVDWDRLHEELGVLSGGERRFLNIAISLGSPDHPVDLADNLTGLDDELLLLVLAATAHAAGRPGLLAPVSTVDAPPIEEHEHPATPLPGQTSPRRTSSRAPALDRTHPRSVRRPEDERRADHSSTGPHDGLRP